MSVLVMLAACIIGGMELVGPSRVEIGQSFEISVKGLDIDLSVFQDDGKPPQIEWKIVPDNGMIRSRLEILVVIEDEKTKWVVSPYATIVFDKPGKIGIVLMVVQSGIGTLLVHEVICGDVNPIPPPDEELWGAVLIEETFDRTPEVARILASPVVESFFTEEDLYLQVPDQNVLDEHGKVPVNLVPYIKRAKEHGLPVLFVMGVEGHVFYMGIIPDTPAAFIALVKQYKE